MQGVDCGDEVASWLEQAIEVKGARLLQFLDGLDLRPSRSKGKRSSDVEAKYPVMYQNHSHVHLTTESSLRDLNKKIAANSGPDAVATADHFRSNIRVTASSPWDEDRWAYVRFNRDGQRRVIDDGAECSSSAELFQLQNSSRCVQTAISRDTGDQLQEPIKTLKT